MAGIAKDKRLCRVLVTVLAVLAGTALPAGCAPPNWPPRVGQPYPDLEFVNHDGRAIRMSDFNGRILLVEPIGMNCPACNGFAGAGRKGGFEGLQSQGGLDSIEQYLSEYAGTRLGPELVLVHLLLYDFTMGAPNLEDARMWAEHFDLTDQKNVYVVYSERDLRGDASYNLIPGFQLVDRDSILRKDSTGHHPRHNLWKELLPEVRNLLDQQYTPVIQ